MKDVLRQSGHFRKLDQNRASKRDAISVDGAEVDSVNLSKITRRTMRV